MLSIYSLRSFFAFWFGTILSYRFAGISGSRKTVITAWVFFFFSILLQIWTVNIGGEILGEQLYPFTTHIPLILWMMLLHGVSWEISAGAVITAYLCCELPNWVSQFASIPFNSSYTVQVIIYCISSPLIIILLSRHVAPSLITLFSKSRKQCLLFTTIPFLYYLWCYSATVYTSYMEQHGYQVAFTMSALFTFLFLIFAITQNQRQEDKEIMKELERARNAEQDAKQEAILANKAKSDFLARMSHEIRTPINAVLGLDEMILRESTESNILDYAAKIKVSGQSLLYLINDILDLSKIESDKMELVPSDYEPAKLISEVLLMIENQAKAKNLELCYEIHPRIPSTLYGDEIRIRQILINLLTNAVKYTEKGSITLSVKPVQKSDKEVLMHFSVADTGIGIKEEEQKLLFESFRRVDVAHNNKIEGTGLGLNITRKLLRLMNSELTFTSTYGVGSEFCFDLRQNVINDVEIGTFYMDFPKGTNTDTYREGFTAPDAKVLVVDDNEMNLLVFCGLLKNSQMNIQTAHSGEEALQLIQENFFDLVFMDHLMPKMDGIEVLERVLDNDTLRSHAPIVLALTANAVSGAKETYLQAGFSGHLSKPISGPKLEQAVREFLPTHKLHEAQPSQIIPENQEKIIQAGNVEEVLDQQTGIRLCAGDKNFYHEVLKAFVQSNFTEGLNDYYKQQDWKNYQILVHGVKSGAKSIGAMKLSELAKESELALKERNDSAFAATQHPVILKELNNVELQIHKLVK